MKKIKEKKKVRKDKKKRKSDWSKKDRKLKKLQKENLDGFVESQHLQASSILSGKHSINNRAFKKWNSSIYFYHSKTNEFRVKEEFKNKTSYAVPKKIKWD